MIKRVVLMSILTLCILALPVNLKANSEPYMITANPGEDAASQMGISWHTDTSITKGKVIYTKKDDENWDNAVTITARYDLITIFYTGDIHHFTAEIDDLEATTEYKYKVGYDDVLSEDYYFKTAGSDEFNFLWVSDWHAWRGQKRRVDNVTNLIKYMRIHEPDIDFIVSTGDDNTYGSDYEAYVYTHEQQQYQDFMWASTVGNHDVMNSHAQTSAKLGPNSDEFFISTHNLPKNGYEGQEGASYFFKNGPMLFIVLNNEDINKNQKAGLPKIKQWVKKVIDENPAQYVMVMMHYQWFDGRTGATNAQYNDWRDFFDENKVDFAMAGNNHVYLRTDRVYDNEATGTTQGTVYLQAPSSDGERGVIIKDHTRNTHIINHIWSQGTMTIGGIIVNVTKEKLEIKLVDGRGNIRDEASFLSRYHDYEFDKEKFKESLTIYPKDESNLVLAEEEGLKFVERIEYYQNDQLIKTNQFHHISHLAFDLGVLNNLNGITAKIKYYDGTADEVELNNKNFYNLENVHIITNNEVSELNWDYDGEENFPLYLYQGKEFIKQVNSKDKSTILPNYNLDETLTIKPKENSDIDYYNIKYNVFGDLNYDGRIDLFDAELMLDLLVTQKGNTISDFYDINKDGILSIIDLTYIHLYANDLIDSIIHESYTVNFYDLDGNIFETKIVKRGDDIIPPTFDSLKEGYIVVGFDKSLNNISCNLEVKPIILKQGGSS